MLKQNTPPTLDNKEQLLVGLITSLKTLFVALSFVVLFVVLFLKSILSLGMVALAALNMLTEWIVSLVASVPEVREFASFLAKGAL